ncbi:nucleotidyltransferase-like protein [Oceanobacillus chungangensis]|uniref:Nucleotidyltransferase-like domain-containing protein n=1 Tax=Oceanobacillus chungangensis TaxID=1229152 RepID=A0A3D8PR37_9BACI|nr:nucleotidyltransferase-like protein [Oceanobacillus chungangensis]RDW17425.1 hypothetical protein CWR45_11940 [Oceanobacillus chungangensis]
MENFLRPIYQERASNQNTKGIAMIEKTSQHSSLTDSFDIIMIIIVTDVDQAWQVKHYEFEGKTAALHIVREDILMNWIDTSGYRTAVEWIIEGQIVFDRNEYMNNLRNQLREFPNTKRDLRKAIEFGKLIKSYSEAKNLFEVGDFKDAHSKIMNSLLHLARLAVIEKGYYPEVTVWSQVKKIDLEVYKLYEEFIESNEEITKKVELMILAMEYVISNRAKVSVNHLLKIMQTKDSAWSFAELTNEETRPYRLDLAAVISYLAEKEIIEIVLEPTKGIDIYQRKYKIKN